jgi:flagellar basal-body rod protein FlgC
VQTTRTAAGGPYKRRDVVLQAESAFDKISGSMAGGSSSSVQGVKVANIVQDTKAGRLEYDPGHPDANAEGYVEYPNVNVVEEMVDMITASRAYEAGVTALSTAVDMAERAMSIGK